jgi:hypothetical protein
MRYRGPGLAIVVLWWGYGVARGAIFGDYGERWGLMGTDGDSVDVIPSLPRNLLVVYTTYNVHPARRSFDSVSLRSG